jgi:hypothetical protein
MDFSVEEYKMTDSNGEKIYDPILEGNIKWDGCINITFDNPIHLCGIDGVNTLNAVIHEIYHIAGENIKYWDEKLAYLK